MIIYIAILLLMIIEGPITTYVASNVAAFHMLNPLIIFVLSFIGDLLGDLGFYYLGRISQSPWHYLKAITSYLNLPTHQISNRYQSLIEKQFFSFILIIKTIPGLGSSNLFLMGKYQVSTAKWLPYAIVITGFNSLITCLLGYYTIITIQTYLITLNFIQMIIISIFILLIGIYTIYRVIPAIPSLKRVMIQLNISKYPPRL